MVCEMCPALLKNLTREGIIMKLHIGCWEDCPLLHLNDQYATALDVI
jgi:hypothetical protein